MSTDNIRIGIIGAGRNTINQHIPKLQALDGVEIVGVCNRSRASSERVAGKFGLPKVYARWTDVIEDGDTNAIVIGTWPYLHARATLAALAADKHVMCEARMARNVREARAMLSASQAKPHLVAQIVPSPLTLPVDKAVQRLIAEGYLGDILAIEVRSSSGAFVEPDKPLHWRQDFDLSGYNTLALGIWYEALMRWVGEATQVRAQGRTFVKMRYDTEAGRRRAVRIPDHLNVLADMACGAQAHLVFSEVTGLVGGQEAYLFGSQGTVRFAAGKLYGGQRGESALGAIEIRPEEAGGWRVEEEFVNAIRGREAITHTDFETGVKYMAFTEAAICSWREQRPVALPL